MIVVSWQRILFRQKWQYIYSQWMSKEDIVYLLMILNVNTMQILFLNVPCTQMKVILVLMRVCWPWWGGFGHGWMDVFCKWTAKGVITLDSLNRGDSYTICIVLTSNVIGQLSMPSLMIRWGRNPGHMWGIWPLLSSPHFTLYSPRPG